MPQTHDSFIPRLQNIQRDYSICSIGCKMCLLMPNCQDLSPKTSVMQGMAVLPHHFWALMSSDSRSVSTNTCRWPEVCLFNTNWICYVFYACISVQMLHNDDRNLENLWLINCNLVVWKTKYVDGFATLLSISGHYLNIGNMTHDMVKNIGLHSRRYFLFILG